MISYSPQLLLTDQRHLTALFDALTLREAMRLTYPQMSAMWTSMFSVADVIDFDPLYRDETTLLVDSTGTVVEVQTRRVPFDRKLAPFVKPMFDVERWNEADADPLADLEEYQKAARRPSYVLGTGRLFFDPASAGTPTGRWRTSNMPPLHDLVANEVVYTYKLYHDRVEEIELIDLDRVDFSLLEEHVIGIRNTQEAFYRNAIFGEPYEPKPRFVPAIKRPPSYLAHDPTKSHKRRRRK